MKWYPWPANLVTRTRPRARRVCAAESQSRFRRARIRGGLKSICQFCQWCADSQRATTCPR